MKKRGNWLQNNNFVRLISLVMGVALWIIVNSSPNGQVSSGLANTTQVLHNVPLEVVTSPNMVAVTQSPARVNISITGSILDVATVQAESSGIRAVANALSVRTGIHQVPVIVENVPTSSVNYAPQPNAAVIDLQAKVGVSVKPEIQVVGAARSGLTVDRPISSVARVLVSGPDTMVRQVTGVTARVDIAGSGQSVTRIVPVLPIGKDGRVIPEVTCTPATITVTIPIRNPIHRVRLVATTVGTPAGLRVVSAISIQPAHILVQGASRVVDGLANIVLPPINVSKWSGTQTVQVPIPSPFPGAHLSTPEAQVTVTLAPRDMITVEDVPIVLVGKKAGVTYTVSATSTAVTVTGPAQQLSALQPSDLVGYVNVSGMKLGGKAKLAVSVSLPQFVNLHSIARSFVIVKSGK